MQSKADASFYSSDGSKESPEYHDPLLHLFKLLIKIDQRVNGTSKQSKDDGKESNENHQRNTGSASQAE